MSSRLEDPVGSIPRVPLLQRRNVLSFRGGGREARFAPDEHTLDHGRGGDLQTQVCFGTLQFGAQAAYHPLPLSLSPRPLLHPLCTSRSFHTSRILSSLSLRCPGIASLLSFLPESNLFPRKPSGFPWVKLELWGNDASCTREKHDIFDIYRMRQKTKQRSESTRRKRGNRRTVDQ